MSSSEESDEKHIVQRMLYCATQNGVDPNKVNEVVKDAISRATSFCIENGYDVGSIKHHIPLNLKGEYYNHFYLLFSDPRVAGLFLTYNLDGSKSAVETKIIDQLTGEETIDDSKTFTTIPLAVNPEDMDGFRSPVYATCIIDSPCLSLRKMGKGRDIHPDRIDAEIDRLQRQIQITGAELKIERRGYMSIHFQSNEDASIFGTFYRFFTINGVTFSAR